jgi:drug/metabolite transporter (DMT)-like permease
VVFGLASALLWAGSSLGFARSVRMVPPASVVAWVLTIGLVLNGGAILATRSPAPTGAHTWSLLVATGALNVGGIGLFVLAVKWGRVGVMAPIASTEGAVAAVFSILAGERLASGALVLLALIVVGVIVSTAGEGEGSGAAVKPLLASILAVGAAAANGGSIFLAGHLSSSLPVVWVVFPTRVIGLFLVALPLALTGRIQLNCRAIGPLAITGFCELAGFLAYARGAVQSVAVAAVFASMFSAFAATGSFLMHGERLSKTQVAGVGCIVIGVGALSAVASFH